MADNEVKFFSFDSEIEQDAPEFILLPEGDFPFMIQGIEKATYTGNSEKIGKGCPMVVLEIVIRSPKGNTSVKDKLYLSSTMEWKLSSFFRSIGMKKHGQKFKMDFSPNIIGKEGLCHIKQETWVGDDGKERTSNRIDKYLDPIASTVPTKPDMSDMPFEV